MRGVGVELCSVRAHRFEFFYSRFHSRFAPGFTPDSRSNSIALHRTRSGRNAYSFNANIVHGLTQSHSIPIPTDRPFKAKTESSAHAFPSSCLPLAHTQRNSDQRLSACGLQLEVRLR